MHYNTFKLTYFNNIKKNTYMNIQYKKKTNCWPDLQMAVLTGQMASLLGNQIANVGG